MDIRVQIVCDLISANLRRKLTIEELAAQVRLSPSRLRHLFAECLGSTPARTIKTMRLAKAKELIASTFMSPKEVMHEVGFTNQSQFVRDLRADCGMTPVQYRNHALKIARSGTAASRIENQPNHAVRDPAGAIDLSPGDRDLAASESLMQAFDECPDPMTISDLESGKYLRVNASFLRLMGIERGAVIGRSADELGLWVDRDEGVRLGRLLDQPDRLEQVEFRFRGRTGEMRIGLYSAGRIEFDGRRCVVVLIHDITDGKLVFDRLTGRR